MFVANQSIANYNQILFSKRAKLFSDTVFIVAIKWKLWPFFNSGESQFSSSHLLLL